MQGWVQKMSNKLLKQKFYSGKLATKLRQVATFRHKVVANGCAMDSFVTNICFEPAATFNRHIPVVEDICMEGNHNTTISIISLKHS